MPEAKLNAKTKGALPWTKEDLDELHRLLKEAEKIYKKSRLLLDKIYTEQARKKLKNIKGK